MAPVSYITPGASIGSHDHFSVAPVGFAEAESSSSSHGSAALDDRKILQPGDFKRVKSQLSLRSRPASRIDYARDSDPSKPSTVSSELDHHTPSLLPDFDLVVGSQSQQLAGQADGDRATFGLWPDELDYSQIRPDGPGLAGLEEELESIADEGSNPESIDNPPEGTATPEPVSASPSPRSDSVSLAEDAHLSQLKQEAEEAWASYRPGMTPQQSYLALEDDIDSASNVFIQPANIPQRGTSLRRHSLVVRTALPKSNADLRPGSAASTSVGSSTRDKSTPPSSNAKLGHDYFLRVTTRASAASGRSPPSAEMHLQRPYTASILSSTSEGSFLSYQNSLETGMRPLLVKSAAIAGRFSGRLQRPVTSGSISIGSDQRYFRHQSSSMSRPQTSNQLTAEERRQQVRRTKKLTHMLGEEMLFVNNPAADASKLALRSQSLGASAEAKRRVPRHQSMPSGDLSMASSKARTFSRRLLQTRSHGRKSLDHAICDSNPSAAAAPAGLNRKAAAILGLPHPYSSSALSRTAGKESLHYSDESDEKEEIGPSTRPFVLSGLEEFNEPTPKVAQLAAFSAAALDDGASPTLPHVSLFPSLERPHLDPAIETLERSHLDQALALSESRKLAAARDERRRRVAKMSRWLGEAVPAELIHTNPTQQKSAVIRSTGAPVASKVFSISHDSSSTRIAASSIGHGSMSHEASVASNLQSFMSIDSTDDESDFASPRRIALRERRSTDARVRKSVSAQPLTSESLSVYRKSIESYEYLLENDRQRLAELASILHCDRNSSAHPVRPAARPRTSPFEGQSEPMSGTLGSMSRHSAAFLDLSDSEDETTSSEASEGDSCSYRSTLRQNRKDSRDKSISKLSNFFGSTPSQIVRHQNQNRVRSATREARGEALKAMLKSLEEEATEDGMLNHFQKSEISRKVRGLKKRTGKLFV